MRNLFFRTRPACIAATLLITATLAPVETMAESANAAPPLGTAIGQVIRVRSEHQLAAALARVAPQTTILIAPGVYRLATPLTVGAADVIIRGDTDSPGQVTLQGPGTLVGGASAAVHAFVIRGRRITLANMTIRDFPDAALVLDAPAASPRIYNVTFLDNRIAIASGGEQPVGDGRVEYSRFQLSIPLPAGSLAPAIVVRGGTGWIVRDSLFKGWKSVDAGIAPAVLFHANATRAVVEANTFVDCAREVVFGMGGTDAADQASGIVRNNFIARGVAGSGAAAITLAGASGTRVLHNSVLMNGTYPTAIDIASSSQVVVQNNLLDAPIVVQPDASGITTPNDLTASPSYFVDAAKGNLHLVAAAAGAIDMAAPLPEAPADWDGQSRPNGSAADFGADEFSGDSASSAPAPGSTTTAAATGSTDVTSTAVSTNDAQSTTLAAAAAPAASLPSPWASQDIGNPVVSGSASYASGTFTVSGAGADIGGTSDQFRFVYQALSGDGQITARVGTLSNISWRPKAGVMIRQSMAANAAYAMLLVTRGGLSFDRRTSAGGSSASTNAGSGTVPVWLRLVRAGSTITAYRSADGAAWTLAGTGSVSMSGTIYIGLALTSHRQNKATTATFTGVSVLAGTSTSTSSTSSVPAPWTALDIGNPAPAGSSTYASGTFTVKGGGADVWGTSDQFQFVFQPLPGDGEVIARVQSLQNTDTWAKAGVMIRASRDANAAYAFLLASAGSGLAFQQRTIGGGSASSVGSAAGAAPVWLRLVRRGSQFSGSRSADGVNWTSLGTTTIAMPSTVYVGLAVTSHNTVMTTTAALTDVRVTAGSTSNALPSVSITSPTPGQTFTAPATVTVAAAANDGDGTIARVEFYQGSALIGSDTTSPYTASTASLSAGTYTVTAVAYDDAGGKTTSSAVSFSVASSTTALPKTLTFTPSLDNSVVTKYVFEVFVAGADPSTARPAGTQDLGKPAVVNGQMTVDVGSTIQALPAGTYFATVSAIDSAGSSRSAPSNTFTR